MSSGLFNRPYENRSFNLLLGSYLVQNAML